MASPAPPCSSGERVRFHTGPNRNTSFWFSGPLSDSPEALLCSGSSSGPVSGGEGVHLKRGRLTQVQRRPSCIHDDGDVGERESCGPQTGLPLHTNLKVMSRTGGTAKSNSTRGVSPTALGEVTFGGRWEGLPPGGRSPSASRMSESCRTKRI